MKFLASLRYLIGSALLLGVTPAYVQAQNPSPQNAKQGDNTPVFHVNVIEYVQRSTKAVSYQHRSGATKIDFEGTPLMPKGNGEAKVETKQGYTEIEVEFDDLKPASQFGPEYTTFVAWAITPEGRATNLGEVILNGNRSKLNVTTELPTFSMIVTAEPHFAVTQPSDVVVLENIVRNDTKGQVELVDTKYELLKNGTYAQSVNGAPPPVVVVPSSKMPLDLIEADNAVRLAKAAGAGQYAPDSLSKAEAALSEAHKYNNKNSTRKMAIQSARSATQTAEDARLIALEKADEARQAEERRVAAQKTAVANQEAADATRVAAEAARRARAEEAARRDAEIALRKAEVDAERADQNAERAAAEKKQAEAAQVAALAARHEAEREAEQARDSAAKAERERIEARAQLQKQLNAVLETRETQRGLVANMSDVLFDTGKSTLKPAAREKLAKVSGILIAHPDLKVEVEGYTDSQGSEELNQKLSESRAAAARDFLVTQGLSATVITAKGLGESSPIASNDTATGRAQNRRVEMVISGPSIEGSSADRTAPEIK